MAGDCTGSFACVLTIWYACFLNLYKYQGSTEIPLSFTEFELSYTGMSYVGTGVCVLLALQLYGFLESSAFDLKLLALHGH